MIDENPHLKWYAFFIAVICMVSFGAGVWCGMKAERRQSIFRETKVAHEAFAQGFKAGFQTALEEYADHD